METLNRAFSPMMSCNIDHPEISHKIQPTAKVTGKPNRIGCFSLHVFIHVKCGTCPSAAGVNTVLFYLFIYLFICLFTSDTHNLDHMYHYQLLVAVTKKKGKQC